MNKKQIPVVDIEALCAADTLSALDQACREWGLFQVVNHGIAPELIERLFAQASAFFCRPVTEKREIVRSRDNPWGYYDRELTQHALDQKEVFDFGPAHGKLIRPQWPRGMPEFRSVVQSYYRRCEALAYRLLAAISVNLGMSPGYLSRGFGPEHTSFLRLNYYPVVSPRTASERGEFGVGQHTDAGALTLLLQDDQPGLEVYRDNRWHLVEPRRDALVVNLGDIVQVWSNDRYAAALHRVIASRGHDRYSVPFFLNPEYRADYAPLPGAVTAKRPARYRAINWGDFRARRAAGDYVDLGEEVRIEHYRIIS